MLHRSCLWTRGVFPLNCLPVPGIPSDIIQSILGEVNISFFAGPFWTQIDDFDDNLLLWSPSFAVQTNHFKALSTCIAFATSYSSLPPVCLIQGGVVLSPSFWQLLSIELACIFPSFVDLVVSRVRCTLSTVGSHSRREGQHEAQKSDDISDSKHGGSN